MILKTWHKLLILYVAGKYTYTSQSTANNKDTSSVGTLIILHSITTRTMAAEGIAAEDILAAVQANLLSNIRMLNIGGIILVL